MKILIKIFPPLIIVFINGIIDLLFPHQNNIYVPRLLIVLIIVIYYLSNQLKNIYNQIISKGWILFFFLGILNINSVNHQTDIWNLKIADASYFYFICMASFNIGLILFEKRNLNKLIPFKNDLKTLTTSLFSKAVFIYPMLLAVSMYISLGFLPIVLGENFTEEMYEFNYGPLYGFKFLCVYSFLFAIILFKTQKRKLVSILYILILIFIVLIDGKRFILLLMLLSMIPIWKYLSMQDKKNKSNKVLIISFITIGFFYVFISGVRSGDNFNGAFSSILEKIPFGVEYKDYVHSYNTFDPDKIKDYNLELSSLGAFTNSSLLNILGYNKDELVNMGSAYAWMRLYDEHFGIRTGIISELFFAYGSTISIIAMLLISLITCNVTNTLNHPKSFFNLIQNSILFALIFLLINGQASVFFGCLPMMIYLFILKKILGFNNKKNKPIDIYNYPCI